mmetsp:Transcript_56488/g.93356  ORF Transcript_56488/g.93356 Transcript_56488/m.93356 type:complete len:239 (-) Transcript_56488:183-899(-)
MLRASVQILSRRLMCASVQMLEPHKVLGIPLGSSREIIRQRFYELAKQTHPDTAHDTSSNSPSFIEIKAAFDRMLADSTTTCVPKTSAKSAAKGWAGRRSASDGSQKNFEQRPPTLGEVLCDQLSEEPEHVRAVWEDVTVRRLNVTGRMADALFRACARDHTAGMRTALLILREGTAFGLLSPAIRAEAIVSLLTWCKEEELDCTFEVCDEIREEDKTPEVLAALSMAFSYFPSGASF